MERHIETGISGLGRTFFILNSDEVGEVNKDSHLSKLVGRHLKKDGNGRAQITLPNLNIFRRRQIKRALENDFPVTEEVEKDGDLTVITRGSQERNLPHKWRDNLYSD